MRGLSPRKIRWLVAQSAEKHYWKCAKSKYAGVPKSVWVPMARIATAWNNTLEFGFGLGDFTDNFVVEIGCGPAGIATVLECRIGLGLDPLIRTYKEEYDMRDVKCQYAVAVGEDLPVRSSSADAVFCVNVLDHVIRPPAVLDEAMRILKNEGLLFLGLTVQSTNVLDTPLRTNWLFTNLTRIRRRLFEINGHRIAHPYKFTDLDLFGLLEERHLEVCRSTMKSQLLEGRFEPFFLTLVCKKKGS